MSQQSALYQKKKFQISIGAKLMAQKYVKKIYIIINKSYLKLTTFYKLVHFKLYRALVYFQKSFQKSETIF